MSLQAVSSNSLNEDTTACICKASNSKAHSQMLPTVLFNVSVQTLNLK